MRMGSQRARDRAASRAPRNLYARMRRQSQSLPRQLRGPMFASLDYMLSTESPAMAAPTKNAAAISRRRPTSSRRLSGMGIVSCWPCAATRCRRIRATGPASRVTSKATILAWAYVEIAEEAGIGREHLTLRRAGAPMEVVDDAPCLELSGAILFCLRSMTPRLSAGTGKRLLWNGAAGRFASAEATAGSAATL